MDWLQGRKTYIVAFVAALTAGANALGYEVPDVVWQILAIFGVVAVKAGQNRIEANTK